MSYVVGFLLNSSLFQATNVAYFLGRQGTPDLVHAHLASLNFCGKNLPITAECYTALTGL